MLKVNEKYSICLLCANILEGNYGDIYQSVEECLSEHPESEVMYGYGIIDNETGYIADWADDWYNTIEEAINDVSNA